jgi:fructose-bisphosphate aldolase class II
MLEAIIRSAEQILPEAIFAVHLDHGDEETCYDCINSGFYSSVMIDASHDPFDKNVEITTPRRRSRPQEGHLGRG